MGWLGGDHGADGHDEPRMGRHRLRRAALRRAALRYAEHGWDVVPGACRLGARFHCGRPGCRTVACHPAVDNWESVASHDPARITGWWGRLPYTVLLATGRAFDAIEVSAELGTLAAMGLPAIPAHGPVAVGTGGRRMFLVRPGHALRPELAAHPDVLLHGYGSWIPAPAGRPRDGRVSWRIAPEQREWRLADPYAVQLLLCRALRSRLSSRTAPAWTPGHLAPRVA